MFSINVLIALLATFSLALATTSCPSGYIPTPSGVKAAAPAVSTAAAAVSSAPAVYGSINVTPISSTPAVNAPAPAPTSLAANVQTNLCPGGYTFSFSSMQTRAGTIASAATSATAAAQSSGSPYRRGLVKRLGAVAPAS